MAIHYHLSTGTMDVVWDDGHHLLGIESAASLADGRQLSTDRYTRHVLEPARGCAHADIAPGVHVYTIRNSTVGLPDLLQRIWLYDGHPWMAIEAELGSGASEIGTRHFDAVLVNRANPVFVRENAALRVLHVPFDNDMWFRYKSTPIADMDAARHYTSNEVTAFYDNESRQAIVLGSITHDVWKTAIEVAADRHQISGIDLYGGIANPTGVRTDTHDTVPHGLVRGARVVSPRIFIGSFADWRDGMEAYAKINASVQGPLRWPSGPPVGWNSWAAYGEKIDFQKYVGVARYIHDSLVPRGFGQGRVIYINLDAFWSRLDAVQLSDAITDIRHMRGPNGETFEPGIYWTPFAYWSDDLDAFVEGTGMKYRYRDIVLKAPDGSPLPKVDGGIPIDPSHPGTKERTTYFMKEFQRLGFAYLKLDFLSHGALEGIHFDPFIQTGTEAYNEGMKQIVNEAGGRMFLSLSIAPLFPSGYGNSRRISCDTKGHISGDDQSTEYMLNSLTYGWWANGNLYMNDPDHVVLGADADLGARNVTEGKSRFLSAVIAGGMILDSSRLDKPADQQLALDIYANRRLFALAAEGKSFRPIEGDTGDRSASAFVRPSKDGFYLAVFNFDDRQVRTVRVPLNRISKTLAAEGSVDVFDIASGELLKPVRDVITIELNPSESKLVELRSRRRN